MSIGYNDILKMRRVEKEANDLGFMFAHSKYNDYNTFGAVIALKPKDDDALPIYSRDAELFRGTLEDVENFLYGLQWARKYDSMLKVSNDAKREKREQDYRNRELVRMLKDEEPEVVSD